MLVRNARRPGSGIFPLSVDFSAYVMADNFIKGLPELTAALNSLPHQARDAFNRGIARGTLLVHTEAIRNAPRSPTQGMKTALRKTTRKTTRKPRGTSRAKRGGLERSIAFALEPAALRGTVYVAANSEAGKYAGKMHDGKGSLWKNRGPGTIVKGPRADEKFIERARDDNAGKINGFCADEMKGVQL